MAGITRESVRNMIKSLTNFNMTQDEMIKALKESYNMAGVDWNDSKYKQLGVALDEVYQSFSNSSLKVTNLITQLQIIVRILEDIDHINF